ncbi:MAG: undecaprenyl-phosphate glucose phosphotransferase [Deltaproteobacteria bacterium]|nr:undecaprenyl-phosphate glucose phosphotransferase [Deltaproteobacteria bacterium]
MTGGRLRPYEPILLTFHRLGDAVIGVGLLLFLAWAYDMYSHIYPSAGILILFMAMASFRTVGLYGSWRVASFRNELHQIVLGCIAVYVMLLLVGYSLKVSDMFSRRVVLTWIIAWPMVLGGERFMIRHALRHFRRKGRNIRVAAIAGAGELGEKIIDWINDNPWSGTRVHGLFDDERSGQVKGYPILGSLAELPEFARNGNLDIIYLATPMREEQKIQRLLRELADSTASVYLVPDLFLFDLALGGNIMYFDGIPVIALRDTPLTGVNSLIKRAEDIVISSLTLLVLSPLMLAIAMAIRITSPGPILFRQWRYGLDGRPFVIYKFRTMTVLEDGYTFTQARRHDPRVTRLGAFLRRTSLDELPQFINVLQGRMSIVGPRPHPVAMNEVYRKLVPGYMLRHKVRPGITGLAQINGWRGETDSVEKIEKRIEYDLEYLRQWSVLLDLKIIARTLLYTRSETSAY